jgi:hypothetical protein
MEGAALSLETPSASLQTTYTMMQSATLIAMGAAESQRMMLAEHSMQVEEVSFPFELVYEI